ncbi:dolichol-phosphate mannose synthase [Pyrococcus yayanosii CH1]|uniref:Dolichol-phosphate mannose synthase n=1 Tax=Pyrococcus yayanosii (strain CH1 / JCM 16557) TaxID=529709 RepID=F8AHH4_PYRYC|nr:dolichol-phosphate mannose synthase [Pyrococcus yayanosii CH1]
MVPAYNEAKRISGVLSRIPDFVDEVIVVDDGSKDETADIAERHGANVVRLPKNRGKGAAMREGVKKATGDVIVFMDADGQHDPAEIERLILPIAENRADFVIGRRVIKEGRRSLIRKLSNFVTTTLLRLKLGVDIRDTQSGFRAIRRDFLPEIESERYEVETEILIKAVKMGARVAEVPVSTTYEVETGHFRFEDIVRFLKTLLRY